MIADVDKLAGEILELPVTSRAFLAHKLIASLDQEQDAGFEEEWMPVIDRRSCEMEAGTVSCRPVVEVVRDLRGQLHALRHQSS